MARVQCKQCAAMVKQKFLPNHVKHNHTKIA